MADTITNPHADQANMTLADEVENFLETCAAAATVPVDAERATFLRKLQKDELTLRKKIEATHKTEKEPHLEAGRAVDAKYKPLLTKINQAVEGVTKLLTKYMEAERERQRQAAEAARKAAEEEAARAAALAKQAEVEEDPFEAFETTQAANTAQAEAASLARQAAAPVKVNVASADGGKAAGLRTVGYSVEVTDPSAFVGYYAERIEVLELAKTLAVREAKATNGQAKVPGCTFTPIVKAI
jgi:hypothetical protein